MEKMQHTGQAPITEKVGYRILGREMVVEWWRWLDHQRRKKDLQEWNK